MRNGAMSFTKRRNFLSSLMFLPLLVAFIVVSCSLGWSSIGADAFVRPHHAPITQSFPGRTTTQRQPTVVQSLSNNNNNNNDNFDLDLLVRRVKSADRVLVRRFERADKIEIRNDATLAACYVFCRFLVYNIACSGARIEPGWEIEDFVWLTGTFSSATVLVVYYVLAGLSSRTYEVNISFTPPPAAKALVNVVLCCPAWLATEHLMGYGPADIAGDTFSVAVATGLIGLGSFMALAKTLNAEMR